MMMKAILSLITAISCLATTAQDNPYESSTLTAAQLQEDFAIFESSLKKNHPNLTYYTSEAALESAFVEIKNSLQQEMSPIEFYRLLTPLLPLIGNNHTNIKPPTSYIQWLNSGAKRFPFRLFHADDTLYVAEDYSEEYTIKEGSVLVSINGVEVGELFDQFLANISTDGNNQTDPILRASNGFSRYMAYYHALAESFEIVYLDADQTLQTATIKALYANEIVRNGKLRMYKRDKPTVEYSFTIEENVGLLSVHTFSPTSAKAFREFLATTFAELKEKNIDRLLIDLRHNRGGYPESSDELLSYFIQEEIFTVKEEYAITEKVYHASYFEEDNFFKHFNKRKFVFKDGKYHVKGATNAAVKPKSTAYTKNVYVLMSGYSSSTTGQLLGLMKTHTKATFLGQEAGGNPVSIVADDLLTLVLPNSKIKVTLPVIASEMNVDFKNQGHGVTPDVELVETIEDWISKEDEVLLRAMLWVKAN